MDPVGDIHRAKQVGFPNVPGLFVHKDGRVVPLSTSQMNHVQKIVYENKLEMAQMKKIDLLQRNVVAQSDKIAKLELCTCTCMCGNRSPAVILMTSGDFDY